MSDWKEVSIGELFDVFSGSTPKTEVSEFWDGEILWATPIDLRENGKYLKRGNNNISQAGLKNSTGKLLPKGALILSSRAPIGYISISATDYTTNQGCKSLVLKDKRLSVEFFYYLLIQNIIKIKELGEGTTFQEISKKTLETVIFEANLNVLEQQKIAKILSTVDLAIEQTQQLISKNELIRAGLMHDLLTCGLDQKGNLRKVATHRFKNSSLGIIPEEWEVRSIEEICNLVTDGSHFSPSSVENGFPIGNVKDMGTLSFILETCTQISKSDFKQLKNGNCSPRTNDVLLSKDGTIGKSFVYDSNEEIVLLSSIAILRLKSNYNSFYLKYLLDSGYFTKQLYQLQSGSALKRLILGDIKKLRFPLPKSISEQYKISQIINKQYNILVRSKSDLLKLQTLKRGLMQDLLTGKVRVNAML